MPRGRETRPCRCARAGSSSRRPRRTRSRPSALTTYSSPSSTAEVRSDGQVGAGVGLGEALAPHDVAAGDAGQVEPPLLVGAVGNRIDGPIQLTFMYCGPRGSPIDHSSSPRMSAARGTPRAAMLHRPVRRSASPARRAAVGTVELNATFSGEPRAAPDRSTRPPALQRGRLDLLTEGQILLRPAELQRATTPSFRPRPARRRGAGRYEDTEIIRGDASLTAAARTAPDSHRHRTGRRRHPGRSDPASFGAAPPRTPPSAASCTTPCAGGSARSAPRPSPPPPRSSTTTALHGLGPAGIGDAEDADLAHGWVWRRQPSTSAG